MLFGGGGAVGVTQVLGSMQFGVLVQALFWGAGAVLGCCLRCCWVLLGVLVTLRVHFCEIAGRSLGVLFGALFGGCC